ncbi:hypothetical protein JCM19241_5084 [Vibrio ishigakensis]|uniref:Uncharacterized protein n=1 Tax=Vibrio ishigakensis TaxID=1481914 RepID=A0A0B8QFG7_9VIBR|nr:hypothetical protein JCM19241_5084 [Vibrio ishigakensis]
MTQIKQEQSDLHHDITQLNLKVAELSQQVADLQKQKEEPKPEVVSEEKKETKEGDE